MKRGCSRGGSKIYETRVAVKKDKAARFLGSRGVGGRKSSFVAAALSVIEKKKSSFSGRGNRLEHCDSGAQEVNIFNLGAQQSENQSDHSSTG